MDSDLQDMLGAGRWENLGSWPVGATGIQGLKIGPAGTNGSTGPCKRVLEAFC